MVGTYVHHDENNKWIIRKWEVDQGDHFDVNQEMKKDLFFCLPGNKTAESDVILRHGDFITLTHKVPTTD